LSATLFTPAFAFAIITIDIYFISTLALPDAITPHTLPLFILLIRHFHSHFHTRIGCHFRHDIAILHAMPFSTPCLPLPLSFIDAIDSR
jgi:hypothetical protein